MSLLTWLRDNFEYEEVDAVDVAYDLKERAHAAFEDFAAFVHRHTPDNGYTYDVRHIEHLYQRINCPEHGRVLPISGRCPYEIGADYNLGGDAD